MRMSLNFSLVLLTVWPPRDAATTPRFGDPLAPWLHFACELLFFMVCCNELLDESFFVILWRVDDESRSQDREKYYRPSWG